MSGEDGLVNTACDRAQADYGLPLLARPPAAIIVPRSPQDDALECQAVD